MVSKNRNRPPQNSIPLEVYRPQRKKTGTPALITHHIAAEVMTDYLDQHARLNSAIASVYIQLIAFAIHRRLIRKRYAIRIFALRIGRGMLSG